MEPSVSNSGCRTRSGTNPPHSSEVEALDASAPERISHAVTFGAGAAKRRRGTLWDVSSAEASASPASVEPASSSSRGTPCGGTISHADIAAAAKLAAECTRAQVHMSYQSSVCGHLSCGTPGNVSNWGIPVETICVPSKTVGQLLGKNGDNMKQVERESRAIVKLEHNQPGGVSICRVYGPRAYAEKAAEMIRLRVAAVAPNVTQLPPGFVSEHFKVDHKFVGLILGRGGEMLREIEEKSGASVAHDRSQEGALLGDGFRIVGRPAEVAAAQSMMRQRIAGATHAFGSLSDPRTLMEAAAYWVSTPPAGSQGGNITKEIHLKQAAITRLLGKRPRTIKEVTEATGAQMSIHHTPQLVGLSTIRLAAPAVDQINKAHDMLMAHLEQLSRPGADVTSDWVCKKCKDIQLARSTFCCGCGEGASWVALGSREDEMQIEQKHVGFLLGPSGATLKQMKEISGCNIFIDQETRDLGYSIVRIGDKGTEKHTKAKELLLAKIAECRRESGRHYWHLSPRPSSSETVAGICRSSQNSGNTEDLNTRVGEDLVYKSVSFTENRGEPRGWAAEGGGGGEISAAGCQKSGAQRRFHDDYGPQPAPDSSQHPLVMRQGSGAQTPPQGMQAWPHLFASRSLGGEGLLTAQGQGMGAMLPASLVAQPLLPLGGQAQFASIEEERDALIPAAFRKRLKKT